MPKAQLLPQWKVKYRAMDHPYKSSLRDSDMGKGPPNSQNDGGIWRQWWRVESNMRRSRQASLKAKIEELPLRIPAIEAVREQGFTSGYLGFADYHTTSVSMHRSLSGNLKAIAEEDMVGITLVALSKLAKTTTY
jgi:hypothetical protein